MDNKNEKVIPINIRRQIERFLEAEYSEIKLTKHSNEVNITFTDKIRIKIQ